MGEVRHTTTCKFCNGAYMQMGSCPKFGLKFRNTICPIGEIKISYKEVRVRNNVPWWKFWKSHFNIENIITENPS